MKEPILGKSHHETAKHMEAMGHTVSRIKLEPSASPNVSLNGKSYVVVGEVKQTGPVLHTGKKP